MHFSDMSPKAAHFRTYTCVRYIPIRNRLVRTCRVVSVPRNEPPDRMCCPAHTRDQYSPTSQEYHSGHSVVQFSRKNSINPLIETAALPVMLSPSRNK